MDRRTFLKAAGVGSISFAYGCNQDTHLFSLVSAPEDMVTGKAAWYASTCTECPAGCGIIAKNREGRIIKLEGNPHHPVNKGKLCMRGQSALQAVYDPDRLSTPKLKTDGQFIDISFKRAFEILNGKTHTATTNGSNRVKMLSGNIGAPLFSLFSNVLKDWNSGPPLLYEPLAHDSLKAAHQALFSEATLPSFKMEKSDFILGFGADFLETWLSPVEYAGKFKAMHGITDGNKGVFIHVGPFMSLTAANADKYLNVRPGSEVSIALGIIKQLFTTVNYDHLPKDFAEELKAVADAHDPHTVEKNSGLSPLDQKKLLTKLVAAKHPLVLGSASPTEASLALDMSVTLINLLLDKDLSLYAFDSRHAIEKVAAVKEIVAYLKDAAENPTDIFVFYQTNPLFTLPSDPHLEEIFGNKDVFKVSFSSFMDETSARADLIFPVRHSLETWDAYASKSGVVSTFQPVMGQLSKAPPIGDVFVRLSKQYQKFENYQHFLMDYFYPGTEKQATEPWLRMIQKGGEFESDGSSTRQGFTLNPGSLETLKAALLFKPHSENSELQFMAVPSIRLYDGRGANKAWLNEIPDPITSIAWESMLFIHPETLEKKGLNQGDILKLVAGKKAILAPVYAYKGVHRDLIVMQLGLGHKKYGRYAEGIGSNPFDLLDSQSENVSGLISYLTTLSAVKKVGAVEHLPKTDGSRSQYKRKIAVSLAAGHESDGHAQKEGLTMDTFPLTLPIKEGYDKKRDVYPAHSHVDYRWGMAVDLDRCIGCSACVAACYAENNIGVVGKEEVINGREMSWLRIERYEDKSDDEKLIFLPMMCQHCDNAPCEAVCPVYAPYHSVEGLNNQIYNRCIGTRFCAQNCPYKVRRFNWYDWKWPKPLNLQLNPNVTVRSKGVMEKCSFCVQRIKQAHSQAKDENRKIRDGDVQPACVQTCPTNALVFGSFLDKKSTLYTQAKDSRAYQVLGYLNTKPAVIYLKKVVQKI